MERMSQEPPEYVTLKPPSSESQVLGMGDNSHHVIMKEVKDKDLPLTFSTSSDEDTSEGIPDEELNKENPSFTDQAETEPLMRLEQQKYGMQEITGGERSNEARISMPQSFPAKSGCAARPAEYEGWKRKPPVLRVPKPNEGTSTSKGKTDKEPNEEIKISVKKLKEELNQLYSISPWYYSNLQRPLVNCIFKVNHQLRQVNPIAYEPLTISIGPYHHGKEHLKAMEFDKKHCLNAVLSRSNNVNIDNYVAAMIKNEAEARRFYAEPVNMSPGEFVKMMLLDGCYIVELIRQVRQTNDCGGSLFKVMLDLPNPAYDLLLLENQLPLFVVEILYKMSKWPNEKSFTDQAISFFCGVRARKGDYSSEVKHLLGLVYQQCLPSRKSLVSQESPTGVFQHKLRTMRHAIALKEAGVDFKPKKVEQNGNGVTSLFEIEFKNGTMEIPTLRVEDKTERILRKLMAYEQFIEDPRYVCDYAVFMDCLINLDKDVELLHRHKIIDNWLGDHEVVAKMFNRLCDHIQISSSKSYYMETYENVDKYCQEPWNEWIATLRHNYFNTPWALISFLAALILLLVTVGQFITSFL